MFPQQGGESPEVVGGESRLLWQTEDEAVARISQLAGDAAACDEVRSRVRAHVESFSTNRFVEHTRAIADAAYVSLRNPSSASSS